MIVKPTGQMIHYSELKPFETEGPFIEEYDTYRREVGRLIAEGHEGKFVLIHGDRIIGIFTAEQHAYAEGYRRYLPAGKAFFVKQMQTYEPIIGIW